MEQAISILVQALPGLISSPAAGIVVALLCLAGFGYFLTAYLLPSHEKQLDRVLEESRENRKVFQTAVEALDRRFDGMEKSLSSVKRNISEIEKDISSIKDKI